jgi:N,N'-diacetyllegionaminate synthase
VKDASARLRSALPPRAGRAAGEGCLVVAEVAQSHDGSLGLAHAFVDAIADAGADAVKFQTHIAAAESTPAEPWRVKFSRQDATRYDYWKRMEFSEEAWKGLKEHADARGLWFLSSPFSEEAAALLDRVGVAAWKVASGETSNLPLLERLVADGRPVLLSTASSPFSSARRRIPVRRNGSGSTSSRTSASATAAPRASPTIRGRSSPASRARPAWRSTSSKSM